MYIPIYTKKKIETQTFTNLWSSFEGMWKSNKKNIPLGFHSGCPATCFGSQPGCPAIWAEAIPKSASRIKVFMMTELSFVWYILSLVALYFSKGCNKCDIHAFSLWLNDEHWRTKGLLWEAFFSLVFYSSVLFWKWRRG